MAGLRRISVVGNTGAGKTTLARALAARLACPHIELDAYFHLPDWTAAPEEEFRARVTEAIAAPAWVVDGNYGLARDLIWTAADTVVWLDLPLRTVMRGLVPRTLRRVVTRETLWNGNRERLRNLLSLSPERSIIAWAWCQHRKYRARYAAAMSDPEWRHLRFVRLRSRSEARAWLAAGVTVARATARSPRS